MPRVPVQAMGILRVGGRRVSAEVCDISSLGIKLRTSIPLEPGSRAIIELLGMPSLKAYVRWSDGESTGLIFETPIPLHILSHWSEGHVMAA